MLCDDDKATDVHNMKTILMQQTDPLGFLGQAQARQDFLHDHSFDPELPALDCPTGWVGFKIRLC